jgi:hypothetical protein
MDFLSALSRRADVPAVPPVDVPAAFDASPVMLGELTVVIDAIKARVSLRDMKKLHELLNARPASVLLGEPIVHDEIFRSNYPSCGHGEAAGMCIECCRAELHKIMARANSIETCTIGELSQFVAIHKVVYNVIYTEVAVVLEPHTRDALNYLCATYIQD